MKRKQFKDKDETREGKEDAITTQYDKINLGMK
jgi:hypothetical protein